MGGCGIGRIPRELGCFPQEQQTDGDKGATGTDLLDARSRGFKTSAPVRAATCCHSEFQSQHQINLLLEPAEGTWETSYRPFTVESD